ncbi:hypothetical protein ScPMuIL_015751 [Solemya velum]
MRYFKSMGVEKLIQIQIVFKINGRVEDGVAIDNDGLRREFFSLFFKECLFGKHDLFEGMGRMLIPSKNNTAIQGKMFLVLGRAIVVSILNGDTGFPYLVPYVFYYLTDRSYAEHFEISHVWDVNVSEVLDKIENAQTQEDLTEVVSSENAHFLDFIGWNKSTAMTIDKKKDLIEQILRWYLVDNRKDSLEQLKDGLNHLGFLDKVKFDAALKPLLVCSNEYCVSATVMRDMLIPVIRSLEANKQKEKQNAKKFSIHFLENITEVEALYLYEFITGLRDLPVTKITFQVKFNNDVTKTLPEAITCNHLLVLPLGNHSADEFYKSFTIALEHGRRGFGNM